MMHGHMNVKKDKYGEYIHIKHNGISG